MLFSERYFGIFFEILELKLKEKILSFWDLMG